MRSWKQPGQAQHALGLPVAILFERSLDIALIRRTSGSTSSVRRLTSSLSRRPVYRNVKRSTRPTCQRRPGPDRLVAVRADEPSLLDDVVVDAFE
jgi:hypothetical protein